MSDEEKDATEADIQAFFDTLPHTSYDQDNQALLAYLQNRSELQGAGLDTDSATLWASWADGEMLVIFNEAFIQPELLEDLTPRSQIGPPSPTQPKPSPVRHQGVAALSERPMPSGLRAVFANGFYFDFGDAGRTFLDRVAAQRGLDYFYQAASLAGYSPEKSEGRLDDYWHLCDAGPIDVLYIAGHGGLPPNVETGAPEWVISVSNFSLIDVQYAEIKSYLDSHRGSGGRALCGEIVRAGPEGGFERVFRASYYIRPQFVRDRWRFNPGSLVIVDSCKSSTSEALSTFARACFDQGAQFYMGWSDLADISESADSMKLFADTTLGHNVYVPVSPPMHAWDYSQTLNYLAGVPRKQLGVETGRFMTEAKNQDGGIAILQLAIRPGSSLTTGYLLPWIDSLSVDEANKTLNIRGRFGTDTPSVSGLSVAANGETFIACDVNDNFSGDVAVQVGQRVSNTVPLTRWSVPISVSYVRSAARPTLHGQLQLSWTLHINLRADIHGYRASPLVSPSAVTNYLDFAHDSDLDFFDASGTMVVDQRSIGGSLATQIWSVANGGYPDPLLQYSGDPQADSFWHGEFGTSFGLLPGATPSLSAVMTLNDAVRVRVLDEEGNLFNDFNTDARLFITDTDAIQPLKLSLDSRGNLQPTTVTVPAPPAPYDEVYTRIEVGGATAESPPNANLPR